MPTFASVEKSLVGVVREAVFLACARASSQISKKALILTRLLGLNPSALGFKKETIFGWFILGCHIPMRQCSVTQASL